MLRTPNFGRKSLNEIKEVLAGDGPAPRHGRAELAAGEHRRPGQEVRRPDLRRFAPLRAASRSGPDEAATAVEGPGASYDPAGAAGIDQADAPAGGPGDSEMRHGNAHRKLGRTTAHRTAMFANMARQPDQARADRRPPCPRPRSCVPSSRSWSRWPRAATCTRAVRPSARSATSSRSASCSTRIGPRYAERSGGYIRVLKAGFRHGDNAAMAVIEFVDRDVAAKGLDSGPVYSAADDFED